MYSPFDLKHKFAEFQALYRIVKEQIDINFGGLQIFISSPTQLLIIFHIGVYIEKDKPNLVTGLRDIIDAGLQIKYTSIAFKIKVLIYNTPAKACGTSSHVCTKCTQIGKKLENMLTYSVMQGNITSATILKKSTT